MQKPVEQKHQKLSYKLSLLFFKYYFSNILIIQSFSLSSMTAMTLCSSCIVYVVAFITTPILRTRNIIFKTSMSLLSLYRFAFITFLAFVSKIEVVVITLWTIPLFMTTTTISLTSISWSRARTIFFHSLFSCLFINIRKDSLKNA